MSNPFNNIITDSLKTMHVQMIAEVVRATSVPCILVFGVTKYTNCPNCIFDPIGNKSTNRYQSGGPILFKTGVCPYCNGLGKISQEETEDINLAVIHNSKQWIPMASTNSIKSPYGFVQTFSAFSTYSSLRRAKELIVDSDVEQTVKPKFEKYAEPEIYGFGISSFILTTWKRIENG